MDEINDQNLQDARQILLHEMHEEKEQMEIFRIKREMARKDKEMEELRKVDPQEIAHKINDAGMLSVLQDALSKLREARPNERSERSRRYAVTITEMEKVMAYFKTFVVDGE